MDYKDGNRTFVLFLCFLSFASAAIIVPSPSLQVESVTSYNITLNWTMPTNELYDSFVVEVFSRTRRIRVFSEENTRTVIHGLMPGFFYSFIVRAVKGKVQSDNSNILQDTTPLPPSNLRLKAFQELRVNIDGIFGHVGFTVVAPGIEAQWEGPQQGLCDCYLASIDPSEGRVTRVTNSDEDQIATTTRQFIELSPGKTYSVAVQSTTCSYGYLGPLLSDAVNQSITLPPSDPPVVIVERVSSTTAHITWDGYIPGFFDGFEVTLITGADDGLTVEAPRDPRTLGRNIIGLKPCNEYGFEVFTTNNGTRSIGSQSVEFRTRPNSPTGMTVTDFTESSVSVQWSYSNEERISGFDVSVKNVMTLMKHASSRTATIRNVQPGTIYTLSVTAACVGGEKTESDAAQVIQATVPLPPKKVYPSCEIVVDEESSNPTSRISLSWEEPQFGSWDSFVLYYSPFAFDDDVSSPQPPVKLRRDQFSIDIDVPATGRIFTGQIRSTKNSVMSFGETFDIVCADRNSDASLKCVVPSSKWTITITTVNITHTFVEVTELPIQNITVTFCNRCNVGPLVTKSHKFYTLNPCSLTAESEPELLVTVFPLCEHGRYCAPIRRRRLCESPRSEGLTTKTPAVLTPPNACCNGKSYHKTVSKCCHGKLKNLDETNLLCCYTRWYDKTTHKCCGERAGEGYLRPSTAECL